MITDKRDIELPAPPESGMPLPVEQAQCETLEPHRSVALDGVLCCGRAVPRPREQIIGIAQPSLITLVQQVTVWKDTSDTGEQYLGDYRFLVLDFKTSSGVEAFVQIWSEPFGNVIVEVGPGNREDADRQAFANEIGGNADNFRKELPSPYNDDPPRVAREMLAILMDVLGYDGRADLTYRFHQGSHLRSGHVVTGLSRSALQTLMLRWGLRAHGPADEEDVLVAGDLQQDFRVHLFCPQPQRRGDFWEIHCVAVLTLAHDKASALVREVNGKPHLMKAFVTSDPGEMTQQVRLALGINLAGGVTLDHVRCQIYEFLEGVRRLRREMGSP
jgi:hypothetical protein